MVSLSPSGARARGVACAAGMALGLALGCVRPIEIESSLERAPHALRRVVVLPFEAAGTRVAATDAELVTSRVLRELAGSELEVISPVDVRIALEEGGGAREGRVLRAFAPDALLSGRVRRFEGRSATDGTPLGPSAVAFEIWLDGPDGTRLWQGRYVEQQRGVCEDLGALGRGWSRGFRWVGPERLAADGARLLVTELLQAGAAREADGTDTREDH